MYAAVAQLVQTKSENHEAVESVLILRTCGMTSTRCDCPAYRPYLRAP